MTAHIGDDVEQRKHYPLFVGMKTYTITIEINVDVPREDEDQSTSIFSSTSLGHIFKGHFSFTIPQGDLLKHIHYWSIHNSWTMEISPMSLKISMDKENAMH